ncbi:MAG: YceI family protein, partial [Verrucomicrobiota bacterium]
MRKVICTAAASWLAWAGVTLAGTFSFDDPKGVNAISLFLDSPLEPIVGWASGVEGTVKYDPLVPDAIEGKIHVATKNIAFVNPRMTAKAHTAEWLNADEHPGVSFTIKDIDNVKEKGDGVVTADLTGVFSLRGVDKKITAPARLSVIENGAPSGARA